MRQRYPSREVYHTNTKVTNYGSENKDYHMCKCISFKSKERNAVNELQIIRDHSKENLQSIRGVCGCERKPH